MLLQTELKKNSKRDLIFLIIRLHLLVVLLVAVFWGRSLLKNKSLKNKSSEALERKARFLPSDQKELEKSVRE